MRLQYLINMAEEIKLNVDAEYLRVHLADCLTHALVELSLKRPNDPIAFLAQLMVEWKAREVRAYVSLL